MDKKLSESVETMRKELDALFGDESSKPVTHEEMLIACKSLHFVFSEIASKLED